MSVLMVGLEAELARTLIRRLVQQDDEVRVIATENDDPETLRKLGAHIARGPLVDADLVERAAQNVRTIVVGAVEVVVMKEILEGARVARVERVVLCTADPPVEPVELLRAAPGQHVVLTYRKRRLRRNKALAPESIAAAVDAADDLGGEPRLELDLNEASSWDALGLEVMTG
ncbi:MAG: hypothetical protein M3391_10475 [Actinomycetota bacterium]|nr:hypothetical protein [Actinomycetota bacterium]